MTQPWQAVLIAAAGLAGGTAGSAGGITSLVSYPALLAAGVPALPADVANVVALVACWPGSALTSRPELLGRAGWLSHWAWVAAAGGAIGSALLLLTPAQAFRLAAPFLVAAGSAALLASSAAPGLRPRPTRLRSLALFAGLLLVSAYGGYFGAGSGIMTLALLLVTVDPQIAAANALKNMLIGAASVVSALTFVIFGPVDWTAVIPLSAGMLAGSMIGPWLARRIPAGLLRWLVALLGLGLAVRLWITPAAGNIHRGSG
jgi:uncharacterized membrane protein YfcA